MLPSQAPVSDSLTLLSLLPPGTYDVPRLSGHTAQWLERSSLPSQSCVGLPQATAVAGSEALQTLQYCV